MKISILLFLGLVGCAAPDHLRKVKVLDDQGKPIKGVERWPRKMLFGKGEFSNKKGHIYIAKAGSVLLMDGFVPLKIKSNSRSEAYFLEKDIEGRSWDSSDIADIEPSQ